MKILILGGGVFLGPEVIKVALTLGHSITVFNRGLTKTHWPAEVKTLRGDRYKDTNSILEGSWDWAIDTSGYEPEGMHRILKSLKNRCSHYVYISTVAVYAAGNLKDIDENSSLCNANCDKPSKEDKILCYGFGKIESEKLVTQMFPNNSLIIRPGIITGPMDPTGRLLYWILRSYEGGEMVVPFTPASTQLQFVDVRDLSEWIIHLVERGITGVYNASNPISSYTWASFLEDCKTICRSYGVAPAEQIQISEAFLLESRIEAWKNLPLWLPESHNSYFQFMRVRTTLAMSIGLKNRPALETLKDTFNWCLVNGTPLKCLPFLNISERDIINKWRALFSNHTNNVLGID